MPWWFIASLTANFAIMWTEYLNRTAGYPNAAVAFGHTWPLILIGQTALFYCWRDAPHFMVAWVVFSVGNSVFRVASAKWLVGEPPGIVAIVGVAVMFLGAWLVKRGL